MKFARLTRRTFLPAFKTAEVWVNFDYVVSMSTLATGGTRIKLAIVDTGASMPVASVDLFGCTLASAAQPTRMSLVTLEVAESVDEILEHIA